MTRLLIGLSLLLLAGCSDPFCEKGATQCGAARTSERQTCNEDQDAWLDTPCAATEVCATEGEAAVCKRRACNPGEWRCPTASGIEREVCADDLLSFVASPCTSEEVCVTTSTMVTADGCEPRLCTAGTSRCGGEGITTARQECDSSGAKWLNRSCSVGQTCYAVSSGRAECRKKVCDVDRCSADGTTRILCLESGTVASEAPCAAGEACLLDGGAICEKVICTPGAARCPDGLGGPRRESCNAAGTRWVSESCTGGAVCSGIGTCSQKICTPDDVKCSSDGSASLKCDPLGTSWVPTPCLASQVCSGGVCSATSVPLGDVAQFTSTSGAVTLAPGSYAMSVADADLGGSETLTAWPVELTGAVSGVPLPPTGGAAPLPPPALECGTWRVPRPRLDAAVAPVRADPPPPRLYAVGDSRTFRVSNAAGNRVDRLGKLVAITAVANLWEDQEELPAGGNLARSAVAPLTTALDGAAFARTRALYEVDHDVDGNGKVDILFSELVEEGGAAAFVNPATLYPPSYWSQWGYSFDFGEVIYSAPLTSAGEAPTTAGVMAHELAHLLEYYRRALPYMSGGYHMVPAELDSHSYLHEGAAELAKHWSGQSWGSKMPWLLSEPEKLSLGHLNRTSYLPDQMESIRAYALGAVTVEYGLDVAGGIAIQSPATVLDRGGFAWMDAFMSRTDAVDRVAPLGGATTKQWWADLSMALMFTTLDGKLSEAALANPRFRLVRATKDTTFPGYNGLTLRWEDVPPSQRAGSGPMLAVRSWASRGTFRRGGLGFVRFSVGASGATLRVTLASSTASLVRLAN